MDSSRLERTTFTFCALCSTRQSSQWSTRSGPQQALSFFLVFYFIGFCVARVKPTDPPCKSTVMRNINMIWTRGVAFVGPPYSFSDLLVCPYLYRSNWTSRQCKTTNSGEGIFLYHHHTNFPCVTDHAFQTQSPLISKTHIFNICKLWSGPMNNLKWLVNGNSFYYSLSQKPISLRFANCDLVQWTIWNGW